MGEIKTHRIFPMQQYDDDLQFGVDLKVETFRGSRSEYHYEAVLLDPDVLADIKDQHAENVASDDPDEPPLYLSESVLVHHLDADTLGDLVCARGDEVDFDATSHGIDHLIQLEDALGYADGSKVSPREAECLFYKYEGHARREIAAILGLGFTTVKTHLSRSKQTIDAVDNEMEKLEKTNEFAEHVGFNAEG